MRLSNLARILGRLLSAVVVLVAAGGLLSLLAVPVLVAIGDTVETTREELFDRPPLPDDLPLAAEISTVHDYEGSRIADLSGPIRRETVAFDRIPEVVIDAVLATEDAEFYEHTGVQHDAMVRAAARNLQAGGIEEGASTITQQYVRMALLDPEQTFDRKLHEIVWAVELEQRLEKDEILHRYLNGIYLGQGVYGFGTAADHYFSTSVEELGLAEAALLAGTIRAPAVTNPVDGPEAAQQRRDVVIRQMLSQGRITEEEAEEVLGTEIELEVAEPELGEAAWVDLVKRLIYDPSVDLQPGLQEAVGASVQERVDALFEGGLTIETTLDGRMQEHARATVASYLEDPLEQPLGSIVSLDHSTGALRAVALGPHEFGACPEDHEGPCELTQINPAVPGYGGSGRQSGSAFKPFVAAAALEAGLDLDAEMPDIDELTEAFEDGELDEEAVEDEVASALDAATWYDAPSGEPIEGCGTPGEEDYAPRNFDDRDQGILGIHEAMRISSNVFFVKLARDVGIQRTVESALEHGLIHSPNLADFVDRMCSLALGSAELFQLEMASGYGVWANDGVRCEPYVIERILDREGEVLYEHEERCERVVEPDVAQGMQELLAEPVGEGGTAPAVGRTLGDGVYGKTGTTNNFVDAWFVGWADGHTTASWIGYQEPSPLEGVSIGGTVHDRVTGGGAPAQMWTDYVVGLRG
jgi:penicillin-binding protein 1A